VVAPLRGEIWLADLDPSRGREQAGIRPALVVSVDLLNSGPSQLAMIVPLTRRDRGVPAHIAIVPPEGGLAARSFVLTDQLRTITHERLLRRLGAIEPATLSATLDWVSRFLGL
jgi:mRNA interferase MazF